MIRRLALLTAVVLTILSSAARGDETEPSPKPRPTYTKAPAVGDVKQYDNLQAKVETDRGTFYMRFFPKEAPKHVASFVKLSRDGFYDGLTFHRVEKGFVVQGGDPEGTGSGGPGFRLPAEFNDHEHVRGAVGMARSQSADSAGCQFYVCLDTASHLDGQYTVFGHVTKGMNVVDKLKVGDHIVKITIEPITPPTPSPSPKD